MSGAALEPEELQEEPRWRSIRYSPHARPLHWSRLIDEKLVLLVIESTASGERFPVGVNWLEVSRVVRRSPVDCVMRYAFLHDAREPYNLSEAEQLSEVKTEEEKAGMSHEEHKGILLGSDDEFLVDETSISDFATPVASPKLQLLDAFEDFERCEPSSPGSPPPFAVAKSTSVKQSEDCGLGGSPFRWENLVDDPNYTAPVFNSPPSVRHKHNFKGRFGLEDDEFKVLTSNLPLRQSPRGLMSPPDSQDNRSNFGAYSTYVATQAFKGLKIRLPPGSPLLDSPLIDSPSLSRKISNSEYPFLKEESICTGQRAVSSNNNAFYGVGEMDTMPALTSFLGDNPFSGSVTQSALEDAFLDMAGSRLDASNVLLSSRMTIASAVHSQSRMHYHADDCRDAASNSAD
ncbi:hypothetical protein CCR75_004925 [Bremia lactucae]|uniref:Myb-like domain-containing protein n=1 Tax=Bremia lactucae TaxID=4779 RepID=A0A976ICF9_BRELC|nr:hypothetical protein CCR75_004925 [Bremia lactucae]